MKLWRFSLLILIALIKAQVRLLYREDLFWIPEQTLFLTLFSSIHVFLLGTRNGSQDNGFTRRPSQVEPASAYRYSRRLQTNNIRNDSSSSTSVCFLFISVFCWFGFARSSTAREFLLNYLVVVAVFLWPLQMFYSTFSPFGLSVAFNILFLSSNLLSLLMSSLFCAMLINARCFALIKFILM